MFRDLILESLTATVIICLFTASGYTQTTVSPQTEPHVGESIPFKRQPASDLMPRVALVFILITGAGIGSVFLIKKSVGKKGFKMGTTSARITVKEAKRVSQKLTMFLVSVDERDYILVQNGDQIAIIRNDKDITMEHPNA